THRFREGGHDQVGHLDGVIGASGALEQQQELVSGQPGRELVDLRGEPGEASSHRYQQPVAHVMAEVVIHRLKKVEINEAEADPLSWLRGTEDLLEPVGEVRPVRDAGEWIV